MKVTSKKITDTSDFKNNIIMPLFYVNNTNEVCFVCAVLALKKLILSYQLCQEIKPRFCSRHRSEAQKTVAKRAVGAI
ncbi:MAG: hypothetical protein KAR43_00475, partial [Deltaproteobacteria bacterium]|nr:hypothetical protein [Deltaproteobacteria bacterium]